MWEFLSVLLILALLSVPVAGFVLLLLIHARLKRVERDLARMRAAPSPAPGPEAARPAATPAAAPRDALNLPAAGPLPPPLPRAVPSRPAPVPAGPLPAAVPAPAMATLAPASPASRPASPAGETLRRIWSWILVGSERRPDGVTAEYAAASVWLLRVGIIAVVTGIAYFLLLPLEGSAIGAEARIAVGIGVGLLMMVAGLRQLHRKYHEMGQGFFGGGVVTLYLSGFASASLYGVLAPLPAYGVMSLVTVAAGLVAVRSDALLIALLGLVGGYTTPILLRSSTGNLPLLYGYVLLLSLGILGVARRRQWHLMNYLAFAFTYALFFLSLARYRPAYDFWLTFGFLTAFFVIHSAITYAHNIAAGRRSNVLEVIHLCANALLYSTTAYFLVRDAQGRPWPALLALGLAAFYVAHVAVFLRRGAGDRPLMTALVALAGAFVVWTLPLAFERETLTVGLSLVGLLFLYIGPRLGSGLVETMGHGVFAVVFFRLLALDAPRHFGGAPESAATLAGYGRMALDRLWTFGLSLGAVAAAFGLQRRRPAGVPGAVPADVPAAVPAAVAREVFYWFGILFAFLVLQLEFRAFFRFFTPWGWPAATALWCATAAYFFRKSERDDGRRAVFFTATAVFLGAALFKLLQADWSRWQAWVFLVDRPYTAVGVLARAADFGAVFALLAMIWRSSRGRTGRRRETLVFGYLGLLVLFLYATAELDYLLHAALPGFRVGGRTVLWALFAIAFIGFGIGRTVPSLRFVGLALFGVVVLKIFFHDLSGMELVFRVVAAVGVGLVLLAGSFAYIFSNRKFARPRNGDGPGEVPP